MSARVDHYVSGTGQEDPKSSYDLGWEHGVLACKQSRPGARWDRRLPRADASQGNREEYVSGFQDGWRHLVTGR